MNVLRRLTVFVDEPDPGVFHWVIIESTENASEWADIEASMGSFDTWQTAWEEGVRALMAYVNDSRAGPRTTAAQ